MAKKPTYKELEQRVKELEREALERVQAEERIKHLNLVLRAIRTVNQIITREKDRDRLLKDICDNLIQTRGYYNAWIALVHESGRVIVTAEAGLGRDFLPMIDYLKRGELTKCGEKALNQSEVVVTEDPRSTCTDCPLAEKYAGRGAMTVRLRYEGKVYGLLSASIPKDFVNDEEEQLLFQEVARDIAFALHSIELEGERNRAEEALRESEGRYRDLVEGSIQGIVIHRNFKPLFVNKAWADMHGYSVDDILKMDTIVPFFAPHEISRLSGYNKARLRGNDVPTHYEYHGVRKDGSLIWVENVVRLVNWQGKPAVQATISDITKRKQAEEALREEKDKAQKYLDIAGVIIVAINTQGEVTLINKKGCEVLGCKEEEIIGKVWFDNFLPRRLRDEVKEISRKLLAGEIEPVEYIENPVLTKSGQEKIIAWHNTALKDELGNIIGHLSSGNDITERKQAEQKLKESFTIINRSSSVAFTWKNSKGWPVEFVSENVTNLFGYTSEEFTAGMVSYAECVHPDDLERVAHEVETFSREKDRKEFVHDPYRIITKDGNEKLISDWTFIVKDEQGNITHYKGIVEDITEKKRLEAQFQAAQRMEAIGTLAGGIAHNFNNLLLAILGNASLMLLEKTSNHPDYERLKNIEQGVKSGAELTRQLLGFAMGGKYEVKPTDINELIKRSSDMFGRTKKEIAIHRKYQEAIWPVEVDQGQIEQVLVNLYVNAWQAMPGGGELYLETENVTLDEAYVKPYDLEPGRYVKIAITDTGVGMDKKTQQRIFEPFFTTKEMGRGTGLGLASVYGIIKNHGGIITVHSVKVKPARLA